MNNCPTFILFLFILLTTVCLGQKSMDEPTTFEDDLAIRWINKSDTLTLVAKNKLLVSLQINFHLRKDNTLINSFLLTPQDSIVLLYNVENKPDSVFKKEIKDSIRVSYYWGHPSRVNPNLDYPYRLPFKKGKRVEVSQSFNGTTSHYDDISRYAIDFQLDVGEPVFAARAGTVIKVIDWFSKQGGPELRDAANRIIILHDDGTMAYYVHLIYKGSLVTEGQKVMEGEKIGISGLTGYTLGPHLHFVVRKENNIAIPIYFKGYEKQVLKKGKKYKVKK